MSKLRKSARDQQCLIRIPNECNWTPETVVLCHMNGGGMGMKKNDMEAAFCCSSCHDVLDGRKKSGYSKDELKLMFYEAAERTRDYWRENNLIGIK